MLTPRVYNHIKNRASDNSTLKRTHLEDKLDVINAKENQFKVVPTIVVDEEIDISEYVESLRADTDINVLIPRFLRGELTLNKEKVFMDTTAVEDVARMNVQDLQDKLPAELKTAYLSGQLNETVIKSYLDSEIKKAIAKAKSDIKKEESEDK